MSCELIPKLPTSSSFILFVYLSVNNEKPELLRLQMLQPLGLRRHPF